MNKVKEFIIKDKKYVLITDFKHEEHYRASFNRLTNKTYGFDFEKWYQAGWWKDNYIPYSFLYENEIVANVSVNPMEFMVQGKAIKPIQLGTVMTENSHRNQGLIRLLMNAVLEKYEETHDFIYLFIYLPMTKFLTSIQNLDLRKYKNMNTANLINLIRIPIPVIRIL